MEQLTVFLTSQSGQYLCWAFIAVGFFDFFICYVVFDKSIKKLKSSITSGIASDEEQVILTRLKKVRFAKSYVIFIAFAMIAFGVFGLTR